MKNGLEINQTILERDAYCPFCEKNGAFLISEKVETSKILQLPDVGCKNAALMGCTFGCWGLVKGYPLMEVRSKHKFQTYGFCPYCGNIYNAGISEENKK